MLLHLAEMGRCFDISEESGVASAFFIGCADPHILVHLTTKIDAIHAALLTID